MGELKKILCPVDLSPGATSAAKEAASLARALGAELVLLHVMNEPAFTVTDPLLAAGEATGYTLPALAEEYRVEMDRRLTRLGATLETSGLAVSTRLVRGTTYESIVNAAEQEHADLIVMGTHGRTGIQHLLLGSVAERVVRTAKVPVMTMRVS
jgi:nucleotide-binding universal stress UspA family protein